MTPDEALNLTEYHYTWYTWC